MTLTSGDVERRGRGWWVGKVPPFIVHRGEALEAANAHHTLGGTVQALRVVAAAVLSIQATTAALRLWVRSDVP